MPTTPASYNPMNRGLVSQLSPQQLNAPVEQVISEDAMSPAELGEFDGATFLADNGLTLIGAGKKDGEVMVADQRGNEATLNMRELMGKAGMNPAEYNVVLNSPDTALEKSPVGFGDRIRLALGNARGQLNYLKANYQDAQMNEDGDLFVKDKGVWHAMDPRGLGDGNGWDLAGELAGDVADFTKDAALGVGQLIGATSGAAAGGVGAVPGAVLGTAVASGATAALGRIVGTYDASPEEVVKDVGLDAFLGLAGEGVALGAKHMIVPAMKRAISKLASANVAGPSKSMVAGLLKQTAGIPEHDTMTALGNLGERVSSKVSKYIDEANAPQSLNTVGNIFDKSVDAGFAPGSDEAIAAVARKDMIGAVKTLVGAPQGKGSAQGRLSAGYRGIIDDVAAATPENQFVDIKRPLSEHWGEITQKLQAAGVLEDGSTTKLKDLGSVKNALGIPDDFTAGNFKQNVESYLKGLEYKVGGDLAEKGPDAMRAIFDTTKDFNDLYYNFVDDVPAVQAVFDGSTARLQNNLRGAANFDLTTGVNGSTAIADAHQWYARRKPIVTKAMKAAKRGTEGYEAMANEFTSDVDRKLAAKENFSVLAELMPTQQQGQLAFDDLSVASAGLAFARSVPKGAMGASLPRLGIAGAAMLAGGPVAAGAALGVTSPRMVLKSARAATKGLSMLGSTMRRMNENTRNMTLADPSKVAALFTAASGGLYDPTAP
jgi:hypothetical protein